MARYIDADKLPKNLGNLDTGFTGIMPIEFVYTEDIDKAPTADVAEVVRCKDCKFWTPMDNGISWHHQGRTDGECEKLWQLHCAERHLTNQDHFCSYGERR